MSADNDLLTQEEWEKASFALPEGTTCRGCRVTLCKAQDLKTREAVAKRLGSRWVITEAHSGYKSERVRSANRAWLGLEVKP